MNPSAPLLQTWPEICDRLLHVAGEGFRQLAGQLLTTCADRRLELIAFCGGTPKAGTTAVVLTLAKTLCTKFRTEVASRPVLLVDAAGGGLAESLGVFQATADPIPVDQEHAPTLLTLDDRCLALLPIPDVADWRSSTGVVRSLRGRIAPLRAQFPLILIDAGPWASAAEWLIEPPQVDGLVSVQRSGNEALVSAAPQSACLRTGIEFLGIIETFANSHLQSPIDRPA